MAGGSLFAASMFPTNRESVITCIGLHYTERLEPVKPSLSSLNHRKTSLAAVELTADSR